MPRVSQKTIWTLYFIQFVDMFQISFVFPLIPKIVEGFGKGVTEIGIVGSVAAAAEGLAGPFMGALADRYGRRPVLVVAMAGSIADTVLTGFSQGYIVLLVARFMGGVCGGTGGVAAAYIADVTSEAERPQYMSYYMAAIFSGLTAGPAVGGLLNNFGGFRLACFCAAGICAVNLVCCILFLPDSREVGPAAQALASGADGGTRVVGESQGQTGQAGTEGAADGAAPAEGAPASARRCSFALNVGAWVIAFGTLLANVGFTAFEALGVIYLQDEYYSGDLPKATLFWSAVISGVGVVGLVTNLVLYAPMERRLGLKGTVLLGGVLKALGYAGVAIPKFGRWGFFASVQLLVLGDQVQEPSILAMTTFVVSPGDYGKAMSLSNSAGNLARAFGPSIYAPIYEKTSTTLPWYANAVLSIVTIFVILPVRLREPEEAGDDVGHGSEIRPQLAAEGRRCLIAQGGNLQLLRQLSKPRLQRQSTWAPASVAPAPPADLLARARSVPT